MFRHIPKFMANITDNVDTWWPLKKYRTHDFFKLLLQKKQNNSNLYTRTSGHVGEYYGPYFSCTESTSYEKKKRLELNLWISVKIIWVLFFFFLVWGHPEIILMIINKKTLTMGKVIFKLIHIIRQNMVKLFLKIMDNRTINKTWW